MNIIKILILFLSFLFSKEISEKNIIDYNLKGSEYLINNIKLNYGKVELSSSNKKYSYSINYDNNSHLENIDIIKKIKNEDTQILISTNNKIDGSDIKDNVSFDGLDFEKLSSNYLIYIQSPTKLLSRVYIDLLASSAILNLTRVKTANLNIEAKYSEIIIRKDDLNIIECSPVFIKALLSDLTFSRINNINSSKYIIETSFGDSKLNFNGELNKDIVIDIKINAGNAQIKFPNNANIDLIINNKYFSKINIDGFRNTEKNVYKSNTTNTNWNTINGKIDIRYGAVDIEISK